MKTTLIALTLLLGFGLIGCTEQTGSQPEKKAEKSAKENKSEAKKDSPKHEGWWCDEHGLPELECWACSDKYAQKCKKAGNWSDKHERPQSQCFKCDPKVKAEWAKKYEIRFGKKPPEFEDY